ncbi:dioxygenase [Ceratobasidium sp. AG-Ba]|nr:dioxygenase [Ceratobasidium sp. AG-Ba]QRW01527.1 dioxygenase [Ceratobasidium sp. AG-Ba]
MKFTASAIIGFISLGILSQAHPGDHDDFDLLPASELAARKVAADARAELVRNCGPQIATFEAERRVKRSAIMKRATPVDTAAAAKYTTIQNATCVTAPEVTEGPYYINNEYYRTDLRESQPGVKLVLDIGIMATGAYGGFTTSGSLSDKFTWLRGGSETNANGVVELTTIYPGFYTGRTIHIHTMIHTSWTKSSNGQVVTIVLHIGAKN